MITLETVLKLDVLKEAKLVSKNHDLQIEVKGINVIEAPDVALWIEGNEILLTNLFSVHDDEDKMRALVRSLVGKNVAAIIIKPWRFVNEIPDVILEEADKCKLAIIEIPTTLRYMDIMYPVMAAVFDSQVMRLSYFKETYHQLTTQALRDTGIEGIIDTIHSIVNNPVVIYDKDYQILYEKAFEISSIITSSFSKEENFDDLYYYRQHIAFVDNPEKEYSQLLIPIKIFDLVKGYLSIVELNHTLSEMDYIALQNAVTVLRLELLYKFTIAETEKKYKLDLIEDILTGRSSSFAALEERAKLLDWDLTKPHIVLLLETSVEGLLTNEDKIIDQIVIDDYWETITKMTEKNLKKMGFKSIVGNKRNILVVFIEKTETALAVNKILPRKDIAFQKQIEDFCRTTIEQIRNEIDVVNINIGFSSVSGLLKDIPPLYQAAQDALTIGKTLYGKSSYCNYENLGVFKLLCSAQDREKLREFIPVSLLLLYEYEKKKPSVELLKTFSTFLENGYNANQTAKDLFIHYKTLHYRLNKIQQISGIDMKNNEELLELQMGIKIMQVLGEDYRF